MFVGRAERERFALERLQVQAASVSHQHRSEKSPHQRALTTSNSSSSERHLERDQQQRGLDPKDYYYLRQDRKRSRRDGSECTRKWQREGDEQQEKMDREKELEAIQEQYLGSKKPKKNVIKPSGRSRFSFDWESTDDTTSYALYRSSPHGAGLLFGRGFLAGIDRREQKKAAAEAHEEARAERRRKDLPLPAEDDVTNKKKKKAGASAFSTSCALDMRVERRWSEKTLEEMTERDWRVFRDHFEISYSNHHNGGGGGGGSVVPKPMRNWAESNLAPDLLRAGYRDPSPIHVQRHHASPRGARREEVPPQPGRRDHRHRRNGH
ncbi:hypothetical protein PR202_gb10305 [Eleusine coracana subsp. coracana]|uniref:PRP28/DDX23-like helical domain-containing protein n=1 Tax=Eleusine coracana subsp. coracana TaxID=191504 RepID=A0AAV5EJT3_ELECO|nr:hypothetical protein PR202_gb10305 [Eleusine coracana subsp. coracana]